MRDLDPSADDASATVFRDLMMLALLGFIAVVLLLLPHVNPEATAKQSAAPPGNVIIEARWPDALNVDVDLWVEAPGDRPVGYSNKYGAIFNLLRDDFGHRGDATALNYEVAYSRGVPAGEYTVNLHLYRNYSAALPVPVTMSASVKAAGAESARQLVVIDIALRREGDEITVVRFQLDGDGSLVADSVHSLPRPLRSASR